MELVRPWQGSSVVFFYNTHGNTGSILLCFTLSNAVPSEVEVPCFEDDFASLETDFTTENQEIGMESG